MRASTDRELLSELRARLEQAGVFEGDDAFYWRHQGFLVACLASSFVGSFLDGSFAGRAAFALAWGLLVLQFGFMGHDAGHLSINRNRRVNNFWGRVAMSLVAGVGFDYWQRRHNQHHRACQFEADDPDMQFEAALSVYEGSARRKTGAARIINRFQAWYFIPMLLLYTYSLRIDGFIQTLKTSRSARADGWILVLHYALWIGLPAWIAGIDRALVAYAISTCFTGLLVGLSFGMNHVGRKSIRPGECVGYVRQQIECTRNLSTPFFLDNFVGGLNFHIEHHLFPGAPERRLRAASLVVKAFCHEHGIAYHAPSIVSAPREVLAHLTRMSRFLPRSDEPGVQVQKT